jgi:hypothetical protein
MSNKNRQKRACNRQGKMREVINAMTTFQVLGLVGETKELNGDIAWEMDPEHQAKWRIFAQEIFSHPERWDEIPAFRDRKAELFAMREEAIRTGYITIEEI